MREKTNHSEDGGVYEIVSPSGKRYIGSAAVFRFRWHQHKSLLRKGTHHSQALQAAWNKYGEDAMTFCILEVVDGGREARLAREQFYIDENLAKGYNVNRFARSREGTPQSPETRAKIKAGHIARYQQPGVLEEHAKRMAEVNRRDDVRAKRSATNTERGHVKRLQTPEAIAKMSATKAANVPEHLHTNEMKRKRVEGNKRAFAEGRRSNAGDANPFAGREHDEETKAKMRAAKLGKPSVKRADPSMCAKRRHPWVEGQRECRACANELRRARYISKDSPARECV